MLFLSGMRGYKKYAILTNLVILLSISWKWRDYLEFNFIPEMDEKGES